MRVKRLSMFALAPLLLVAICAQSAFAATWTSNGGVDHSTLSSSGNPSWTDAISQSIDVHLNDQFTWTNKWTNNYPYSVQYGYQWSSGIAYGTSWWSSDTISTNNYKTATGQGSVYRVPFDGWPDLVNINQRYTGQGLAPIGTDFWGNQGLTART